MAAEDIVILVDEVDQILGYKRRDETLGTDRWRDTEIFLINKKGEILFALRDKSKKVYPNMWGSSAAGTVEKGESYMQNALKELAEELGVTGVELRLLGSYPTDHGGNLRYTGLFLGYCNKKAEELKLEKGQVTDARWVRPEQIFQEFETRPETICPFIPETIKKVLTLSRS